MKTFITTFTLLAVTSVSHASEWSFNYLNKLYQKDQERCYERCQTVMNLFPNQESAYFFAMRIQVNEAKSLSKVKSKGARMIKAIDYARYFDENASIELKNLTQWDTVEAFLFKIASEIRLELDKENLNSNIKSLDSKWEKYSETSLKPKRESKKEEVKPKEITKPSAADKTEEGKFVPEIISFNGMPKGTENVAVYDFQGEKELLIMINKERKRQKMDTLLWNSDLSRACRYHATDMGAQDYFDHNSYDISKGKLVLAGDTFDRIRAFYSSTFVNSENIAAGNASATATYEQWYNSPGHYANMFNKSSKKVGIGMARVPGSSYEYYWVFCTAE